MLPMDTKPVTSGNVVVLTSKLRHQTSPVPCSTENRGMNATLQYNATIFEGHLFLHKSSSKEELCIWGEES